MRQTDKYVFFWGGEFSQWYKSDFAVEGVVYTSCEQFMMHKKALFFLDEEIAEKIMQTNDPKKQKALGRSVRGFKADEWSSVALSYVIEGNFAKFSQNEKLKQSLIATGSRILVEASPHDRIWGVGRSEDDVDIETPMLWNGTNLLGFALVTVRNMLI